MLTYFLIAVIVVMFFALDHYMEKASEPIFGKVSSSKTPVVVFDDGIEKFRYHFNDGRMVDVFVDDRFEFEAMVKPIETIERERVKKSQAVSRPKAKTKRKTNSDFSYEDVAYYESKRISSEFLHPKKNVEDKSSYFYGKKVVITGDFEDFEDRNLLAEMIWDCGADIDINVGKNTAILIIGYNPGPKKIEAAAEHGLEVIDQFELESYIDNYNEYVI